MVCALSGYRYDVLSLWFNGVIDLRALTCLGFRVLGLEFLSYGVWDWGSASHLDTPLAPMALPPLSPTQSRWNGVQGLGHMFKGLRYDFRFRVEDLGFRV
jgi:hypothetical protein